MFNIIYFLVVSFSLKRIIINKYMLKCFQGEKNNEFITFKIYY